MKQIFIATVLTEYEGGVPSAYSAIVSSEYDKELFESWIREEIESLCSDYPKVNDDSTISIAEYGKDGLSGMYRSSNLNITIDIQSHEIPENI